MLDLILGVGDGKVMLFIRCTALNKCVYIDRRVQRHGVQLFSAECDG